VSYAIETEGLRWRAGRGANAFELQDVSIRVPRGAMYGFLGPNGAGKSTTIKVLVGLLRPHAGRVAVLDTAPSRPQVLARIGYVPERPHVYPSLTVDEAMRFHAAFHPRWDQRWAEDILVQFGLERSRRIARLSKGETGKLLMLLALAQRPELLVLDEPTDGLDPVVRREVMMALIEYVAEHDATVFISSHLVHELERICNWVGVMDRGRVVAELPMDAFKSGIKRLRVRQAPPTPGDTPFLVLAREASDALSASEVWVVRGWQPPMRQWFEGVGATLHEVVDLDLEEGYVELLRTFRGPSTQRA
jgi:ABC-2 type transport system ATP-binding protein